MNNATVMKNLKVDRKRIFSKIISKKVPLMGNINSRIKQLQKGLSKISAITIIVIILIGVGVGYYYFSSSKQTPATVTSPQTTFTTSETTSTPTTSPIQSTTSPPSVTATSVTTTQQPQPSEKKVIHKIIFYLIQNDVSARILTVKKGVADFGEIPVSQLRALVGTTKGQHKIIKKEIGLTPGILYITLNTLKPPFNNVYVRQALAFAIPYEMIYKTVYDGTLEPLPGVLPKGLMGYTTYNCIRYKLDMKKAKELIAKSGIDPTKYMITIYTVQGIPEWNKIATLLSTYWGQLGFKVSVQALTWPQILRQLEKPGYDVYIMGWGTPYNDPDQNVGPLAYGGTKFDLVKVYILDNPSEVSKYVSEARVIDTPNYYVVVGPVGKGGMVSLPGNKKILLVQYKVSAKQKPPEECTADVDICESFYRNVTRDALCVAGRYEIDPKIREPIYQAIEILTNHEVSIIWLGQRVQVLAYWDWVKERYYNPFLGERWDLVYETPISNPLPIGIDDYFNNASTLVQVRQGWPQSFDPAADLEYFGNEIYYQVGDTLVTYWKEDSQHVVPDVAVAWAHNSNGTEWYFVIRGGMKAYDPATHKLYPINATDALFTIWRFGRLGLDPSYIVNDYIDVNKSAVYTEKEFSNILSKGGIYATYHGKTIEVRSLENLLTFFGYNGPTAGVVMLKLHRPYGAILHLLTQPLLIVVPMKWIFDNVPSLQGKYAEALKASDWGKNPSAWASYIGIGEKDPTHQFMHTHLIGSGPYYIADFKRDSYIVLKLNLYYWNATLWMQLYNFKPKP